MGQESRFDGNYIVPAETMEKIDRALKFYAAYGSWHYSDREMRAPPRACSAMDRRPQALIDSGKFAGEVYAELVKLYPLEYAAASEKQTSIPPQPEALKIWERPVVKRADDLNIHGELWGLRFTEGCSNGCAELYVEDDDFWHLKATFDRIWLADLLKVLESAKAAGRFIGGKNADAR